jgi:TolB-like protein
MLRLFRSQSTCAVLMDFGLAREFHGPTSQTVTEVTTPGAIVGTPGYMAPEQFEGNQLSPATDVYALGVALYELVTGKHPFAANTPIRAAILRGKRPSPASSQQRGLPRRCDQVIFKCLEFNAEHRYQSAREVAEALRNREFFLLQKWFRVLTMIITVIALGGAIAWWKSSQVRPMTNSPARPIVAVLPFGNMGADKDFDFLRVALPDEIATTLSHVRSLSIRPFATTSKYLDPETDLQRAGREMHVNTIVTGHFLKAGDQLQITLEAIDVDTNQTVWRDTLNIADRNMIAMQEQVLSRIDNGLIPALGPAEGALELGSRPKSEEAYDLFLRSKAMPDDPFPNKEAIHMLERAVGLDPAYAPAWAALGQRYYFDSRYSDGGESAFGRSNFALERAKILDPDLISAAGYLV